MIPTVGEGNVASLRWAQEWDGQLCISTGNVPAAQVPYVCMQQYEINM
jgi:hypothetical protein